MTTAFLYQESDILMLHRSNNRRMHPNQWTGVGGHVEPHEISDPDRACQREITEETGILPDDITDLRLRYIILRQWATEIRQQYVYFGTCATRNLASTDEGELVWVPQADVLALDLVPTTRLLLSFHLGNSNSSLAMDGLWVGVVGAEHHNGPSISWSQLQDWEGLQ